MHYEQRRSRLHRCPAWIQRRSRSLLSGNFRATRARLRVGLLEDDRRSRKRSRSFVCSGPIWPVRAKSKPDSRDAGAPVRKVLSVEVGSPLAERCLASDEVHRRGRASPYDSYRERLIIAVVAIAATESLDRMMEKRAGPSEHRRRMVKRSIG